MIKNEFYEQTNHVVMQSPLDPGLAGFEITWLKDGPVDFIPVGYRQHVHKILVLLFSLDHTEKFKGYLSSKTSHHKLFIGKKMIV